MPVGKPRITPEKKFKDRPTWKEDIILEMSEGASLEEIKGILDIPNSVHTRWMRDEKEYQETIKRGIRLSKAWWEGKGRKNLDNNKFNYVGWYMNMKNRFGWRDKQDITTDGKELPQPILGYGVSSDDSNKQNSILNQ